MTETKALLCESCGVVSIDVDEDEGQCSECWWGALGPYGLEDDHEGGWL